MKEQFNQFNGLKVFFCAWIVVYHYSANVNQDISLLPFSPINKLFPLGHLGVDFFFMLSGFLIAYTYKQKIVHMTFFTFIKRRFRILWWSVVFSVTLAIFTLFLQNLLLGTKNYPNFYNLMTSLTLTKTGFLENSSPYGSASWFVHVLLLCYIFYFLIVKICQRYNQIYVPLCTLLMILGIICKKYNLSLPFLFVRNGNGYCSFFLGILFFEFYKSKLFNHQNISILSSSILLVLGIFTTKYGFDKVFGNFKLSFSLFVVPAIIYAALNIKWLAKLLSCKLLSLLSIITMPIFLSHQSVMSIIWGLNIYFNFHFEFQNKIYFFINMLIILISAILWYFLLEKRLIPLLNRKIKKYFLIEK